MVEWKLTPPQFDALTDEDISEMYHSLNYVQELKNKKK